MKVKSITQRAFLVAMTLFKYTDENHKLTLAELNGHLRPYGLDCTTRCVKNIVNAMQAAGIKAKCELMYNGNGFWIDKRSLSDEMLKTIAFAVSTNPNISETRRSETLEALRPYVQKRQEYMLTTISKNKNEPEDSFADASSVICEAIERKQRVLYHTEFVRYNRETKVIEKRLSYNALATPKCICRVENKLYMICYQYTFRRIIAVDLNDIVDIKLAAHINLRNDESEIRKKLEEANPWDYILEENPKVIYKGPVTFMFKGKYLKEMLKRFGYPEGPIKQDTQSITEYTVPDAVITTKTLFWLTSLPDNGIRLKGPKELTESVREYYSRTANILTDARKGFILWNKFGK